MNSISVLKKSFSWKFGYPKFQRKVKLQYEKDGEDVSWQPGSVPPAADVCWDFDQQGEHSDSDSDLDSDSEVANPVQGFPESECSSSCSSIGGEDPYSSVASPTSTPIYENQPRDEEAPVYENADVQEPVYHNWSSPVSDCDDHIYEHVNPAAPVNVFLALLQGRADAISPDPNIYEVPPGAIFHHSNTEYIENLTTSLTPPEGFQDYENLSWSKQQKIDVSEEEILTLPVEAIYSTVVKPKRRKSRPTITAMLHKEPEVTAPVTTTNQPNTAPAEIHTMDEGVDKPDSTVYENTNCYSNVAKCNGNVVVSNETVATQLKGEPQTEVTYSNELDCCNEYENVVVSGNGTCIDIAAPKNEDKNENLLSPEDSKQECLSIKKESSVSEDVQHEEEEDVTELAPVIEISDDGTWETKALPEAEVEQVKQQVKDQPEDTTEFLASSDQTPESVKIKHVALAYGSQYYVNCPVASVKPMQSLEQEQPSSPSKLKKTMDGDNVDEDSDTRPNIGAQIMKQYDQERQKAKESRNLPDVSLLDVDASLEDIQRERRRIIESQAVRAKRIDSWIKNGKPVEEMYEDALNMMSNPSTTECWITSADLITEVSLDEKTENTSELKTATELEVCDADEDPTFDKKISDPATGEVVYDSILQNKHKTKSYWEQLMMAAATSDQPKAQYHSKRDLLSVGSDAEDGKPNSDVSEQEYFDAQSQISLHSPPEPVESLDVKENGLVPKIVETVAKKLMENESVVEREIRLQREREAALVREREEAMQRARALMQPYSTTPAETKIAMELREMREREDELRRLRQQLSSTKETGDTIGADDGLNSIPNTDEGNFSEYGSEEKELSLDETNSRMVSPEVPTGGGFSHQRTESLDSMSSGHSSGSGEFYPNRRRIVVKPLDEPEEEVPSYMRIQKETPIEREIRLAREREEELRREKGLPPNSTTPNASALKQDVTARRITNMLNTNDSRSVQHRLATSRIQQEINEATEREKELRAAGTIQTTSEDTVDSKVTRFTDLAEYAIEERERRLQKSVSTSNIPTSVSTEADGGISTVPPQPPRKFIPATTFTNRSATLRSTNVTPNSVTSPKKFSPSVGQKGLMQRFLASHGKVTAINSSKSPGSSPQVASSPLQSPSYTPPVVPRKIMDTTPTLERQVSEGEASSHIPMRRGYQSAEEKIQAELQEMQKREEELRLQRAHMFAQSQPNLLFIGADDDEHEEDSNHMNGDLEKPSGLRSVLSNPNFLDSEDNSPMAEKESSLDKPSHRNARKRNALIAEWENRIQQNIDH